MLTDRPRDINTFSNTNIIGKIDIFFKGTACKERANN